MEDNQCACKINQALTRQNEELKEQVESLKTTQSRLHKQNQSHLILQAEKGQEINRLNKIIENAKRILDMAEIEF